MWLPRKRAAASTLPILGLCCTAGAGDVSGTVDQRGAMVSQYAPPPEAVDTGRYLIGAQMVPLWSPAPRWGPIKAYPDREPVLGWYAEGEPEVTDWEIKYALEHGISFFMVCWFRDKDNLGKQPIEVLFDHWVMRGLKESRYGNQIKFAIMWENVNPVACGVDSESDLTENLLPFWIEEYFSRPNYLRVDGMPVLSIFAVQKFIDDLGGEKKAAEAVEKMRAACRDAGLGGLMILGQHCWGPVEEPLRQMDALGFDYAFAYHLPTFMPALGGPFKEPKTLAGDVVMDAIDECWELAGPVPYIPTISMGWDSRPWGTSHSAAQWRLTPDELRVLCQRAKDLVDRREPGGLDSRMILLDNWNEYGEGHYIFPTRQYGFGYLDAIREVFAPGAGPHVDLVPGPGDALE